MLYYNTIDPSTLALLRSLQSIPEFGNLRLVGGTSLALQIGHRTSIDLDLFGTLLPEADEVLELLRPLGSLTTIKNTRNIHQFILNGIKVDIINYAYPWLNEAKTTDNLRLAGMEDIAAMKLAAVTGRGTRKDFIDIWYLLRNFTLEEMLTSYTNKYADGSTFMVIKSLTYFEDAENEPEPYMFEPIDWETIKSDIREHAAKLT